MKKNHISENIKALRALTGLSQKKFGALFNVSRDNIASYERGTEPKLSFLKNLVKYFHISYEDFIHTRLEEFTLNNIQEFYIQGEKSLQQGQKNWSDEEAGKNTKSAKKLVDENDHKNDQERKVQKNWSNNEPQELPEERVIVVDTSDMEAIPIIDISAAARRGAYNPDYITEEDVIRLPSHMLHKGTHHCIRITGQSMFPTFMDGGYIIIRLLDRSEWGDIKEKYVYVVTDREGKTYVKRLKNRLLEHGFIVCMSDNPDKTMFPNFNLREDEIHNICEVEWYMTSRMPNIHDTYYNQVQTMQDDLDELKDTVRKYMISNSGKNKKSL